MVISVRTIGPPLEQRVDKATFWSPFQPYCLMVLQCPFWGGHRDSSTLRLRIFPRNLWQAQSCSLSGHSCREPCLGHSKEQSGAARQCSGQGNTAWAAPPRRRWLLPKPRPDRGSWSASCGITSSRIVQMRVFPACQPPLACVKLVHLWLYSLLAFNSFCCCIGKASLCPYFSVGMLMRTVCPF